MKTAQGWLREKGGVGTAKMGAAACGKQARLALHNLRRNSGNDDKDAGSPENAIVCELQQNAAHSHKYTARNLTAA